MGNVVLDVAISLDGFSAGPNDDLERIHAWMGWGSDATDRNAQVVEEFFKTTGAVVMGKRTWDGVDGPNGWGPNGWAGLDGAPLPMQVFVVTHESREAATKGKTTFTFVTKGLESALEQAKAAAGDRNVYLMGAKIAQQCLKAGTLDEIVLHLVPVLLTGGIRLFDQLGTQPIELERTEVIEVPGVTHLRFRVVRKGI
jgi:dihydrofolate reductase